MLHLHILAQEVTPSDPATLAWPAIAGGVAAVVTTVGLVGAFLVRVWRRLHRGFLEPLGRVVQDWMGRPAQNGTPAVPGIMARMRAMERHIGNGTDRPLRELVCDNAAEVTRVRAMAEQSERDAAASYALAKQNADALAEHYVRGHGG